MSYTHLVYHIVFATKERRESLPFDRIDRICKYAAGIISNNEAVPLAVNGVSGHLHVVASLGPKIALSQFVGTVKANCSKWIHKTFGDMQDFSWQDGYSAFTVSASVQDSVVSYIRNQEVHHRRMSFQDELIRLLDRHGIEYDPKYVR
ncbi:MAG: IS200/IS605 family transposase [Phycisphaerae bacterium]|jgi:REP element-mobilizing transposase RayT|nr:IS200/IS605 family transposase [Phycisphaerae bacterium]